MVNGRIDLALIERMAAELAPYRDDDEQTYLDTLDGETDALDILDREIEAEQHDRALVEAIKSRVAALRDRAERIEMRADARKRVLRMVVQAMGLRKVERPLATLSIRAGAVSVAITDEAEIPTQLCAVKTVSAPDKKAIRAMIEAGEAVPGAELVRGEETISVRVK
jgi:DNA repair exonuclease SbcCD ATPase subunit